MVNANGPKQAALSFFDGHRCQSAQNAYILSCRITFLFFFLCHGCSCIISYHYFLSITTMLDESMGKFNLLVLPIPSKAYCKTRFWFPEQWDWKFNLLISNIPIKPSVIQETVWAHRALSMVGIPTLLPLTDPDPTTNTWCIDRDKQKACTSSFHTGFGWKWTFVFLKTKTNAITKMSSGYVNTLDFIHTKGPHPSLTQELLYSVSRNIARKKWTVPVNPVNKKGHDWLLSNFIFGIVIEEGS